jgi:hypothetical protein
MKPSTRLTETPDDSGLCVQTEGQARPPSCINPNPRRPESQYLPYFAAPVEYYLAEMGIAVVAPNVRGSEGYGKAI